MSKLLVTKEGVCAFDIVTFITIVTLNDLRAEMRHTAAAILIILGNFLKRRFYPKPLWYILFTVASLNFPVAAKLLLATSAASPREICF